VGPRRIGAAPAALSRRILLFALCGVFMGLSGAYFVRYLAKPATGLVASYPEVVVRDGRTIFSPRALFSPAVSAGLLPNRDEILSIDGAPIHGTLDVIRADAHVRGFSPVALEVRGADGVVRSLAIHPALAVSRIDWVFILVFLSSLGAAALILSLRVPDAPGTLPLVLAALTYLVFTAAKPFYYESLLSNSLIHLGKLTSWLLVFFGLYFPAPRGSRRLRVTVVSAVFAAYGLFIALRIGGYLAWTSTGAEEWLARYRFLGRIGNVSDGVAYVVWAALMVSSYRKAVARDERRQMQWILAGILIALPPYFFFDQLPLILGQLAAPRVGLGSLAELFLSFIPVFLIIGLTRHRMFDIRFLLSRYALYGSLFLLMVVLFAFLFLPLRDAIVRGYGTGSPVSEFLAAGALLLLLVPLRFLLARAVGALLSRRGAKPASAPELSPASGFEGSSGSASAAGDERLAEVRALLRGVAARVRAPLREITSGVAGLASPGGGAGGGGDQGAGGDSADSPAQAAALEASVRLGDFLHGLEALAAPGPSVPALAWPRDLLDSAIERTRRRFPLVECSFSASPTDRVSCFPGELTDALCRVTENAAEAVGSGGGGVRVELAQAGQRVLIEIIDGGPGMGPAARARAFRPFNSTKPGRDGMGLYFTRLIVERIGGTVDLESRVGEGARVRFSLPAASASTAAVNAFKENT
jgi:signal transduction histidine kinase